MTKQRTIIDTVIDCSHLSSKTCRMWTPCLLSAVKVSPMSASKMASSSNPGSPMPCLTQPSSPPCSAERQVECSLASSWKSAPPMMAYIFQGPLVKSLGSHQSLSIATGHVAASFSINASIKHSRCNSALCICGSSRFNCPIRSLGMHKRLSMMQKAQYMHLCGIFLW